MMHTRALFAAALVVFSAVCGGVAAQDLEARVRDALESEARTAADRERDANREPLATLEFMGLKPQMKVLELLPGGGWYTKILAPVLAPDGELHVAIGTSRVADGLLQRPGFDAVKVLDIELNFERNGPFRTYNIDAFTFPEKNYDLLLTFRNLHNFTPRARQRLHSAAFAALKSGGVYGVVDHTARHMEPMTDENRRRLDPVQVIKEILAAGFKFEDWSDVHYRPDDELRYEVGRRSVTGNTDRFTLRFRKPR